MSNNKNYLIIGAGSGIGLETAKILSSRGEHVYALVRRPTEELEKLDVHVIQGDAVLDEPEYVNGLPEVIHGLVYSPGSINLKPFNRLTEEDFLNDFRQNVLGAVRILKAALPRLKAAAGASVVMYSTVAVQQGMPFHASVAASKAAVEGLARSLAAELAASRIRVNAIAPSLTDTQLASGLLNTPEKREAAAKRHPLGRIGSAAEIAELTAFLLSDQASWISGQVIGADGGLSRIRS